MINRPVLIIGARSDIGQAVAHAFAAKGHPIQLAARGAESLEADVTDMKLRFDVPVSAHDLDVLMPETFAAFIDELPGLPHVVVCAVGLMGEQLENEAVPNGTAASIVIRSNFEGPAAILGMFANRFADRGAGVVVGISSVAGDRGRATNYIYGSAKAGFTAYLSGLRNRMASQGVHVLTVLPGFVATKMTEDLDLPDKLTAQPDQVGQAIVSAVAKKRNVIYLKPVWQLIMLIIRNIPEAIFKRLKL